MAADNLLPSNPSSISNKNRKSSTSVNNPEFIIGSNEFLLGVSGAKVIIPGTKNRSYISCLSNPSINSPSSSIKLVYEEPISEDDSSFAAFTSGELQTHVEQRKSLVVGYFQKAILFICERSINLSMENKRRFLHENSWRTSLCV